jgi:uncharacterized coiled-coil protein SlyX
MYYYAEDEGKGVRAMDEEMVLLEEQLAAAHADVERLQERLADLEASSSGRESEVTHLRDQVAAQQRAITENEAALTSRSQELQQVRTALEQAGERTRSAAARYREIVLQREPELPGDLVGGETVEEVDAGLERARQTVAQVRQHLESQAQAQRIPPGAPARREPDLSELSAADKIRLGLQQA